MQHNLLVLLDGWSCFFLYVYERRRERGTACSKWWRTFWWSLGSSMRQCGCCHVVWLIALIGAAAACLCCCCCCGIASDASSGRLESPWVWCLILWVPARFGCMWWTRILRGVSNCLWPVSQWNKMEMYLIVRVTASEMCAAFFGARRTTELVLVGGVIGTSG